MNWSILVTIICVVNWLPKSLQTVRAKGDVDFYFDKCLFYHSDSLFKVEVYYLVDLNTLSEVEVEKKKIARYEISVRLEDMEKRKKPIYEKWKRFAEKGELSQFVIDEFSLWVRPGKYKVTVEIKDLLNGKKGVAKSEFEVGPPLPFFLSEIELAREISADTTKSPFTKYGLNVVPNPLSSYSPENDTLYFFFEIFTKELDTLAYAVSYGIFDKEGRLLQVSKPEVKRNYGRRFIETGGIYLDKLEEGDYKLLVRVVNLETGEVQERTKFFRFYKEKPLSIPYRYREYIEFIDYIASEKELKSFRSLKNRDEKEAFLYRFWRKLDPNPETPENEYLEEFVERVKYADKNFSTPFKKGRYTDRGKIYIKYGPPDELRRVSLEMGEKDREVWYYFEKGGLQFIFVDLRENGDYVLMYTNAPDEPHPPDWWKYIPRSEVEEKGW